MAKTDQTKQLDIQESISAAPAQTLKADFAETKVKASVKKALQEFNLEQELPWIQAAPGVPYFVTEHGENWMPIGQNDAISWPEFDGLFKRKNLQQVEEHLAWLSSQGVTCLRLMLEYAQVSHRYIERPVGTFPPNMVRLWDDLFALCARYNMRILLTPFDTFWMWIRWKHHPYNVKNGGTCRKRSEWLLCKDTLQAIKNRLSFATRRWGGSGVLFAWDLWNEIHPAHADGRTEVFGEFVQELSQHLREEEIHLYGRCHLQTVSLFGPVLNDHPAVADVIFRHPLLNFASTHFYDSTTIDNPRDTVAPAIATGRLVREALEHLPPERPFFDSEHGPIHAFKDKHIILPEYFDDEYFRHMQWAHLASGGANGGMRWPNRHPHCLTHGMRRAQQSMAAFTPLINWKNFRRRNLNQEVRLNQAGFTVFACADGQQAVVWLLRTDSSIRLKDYRGRLKTLDPEAGAVRVQVQVPGMAAGTYFVTQWHTLAGKILQEDKVELAQAGELELSVFVATDVALAITKIPVEQEVQGAVNIDWFNCSLSQTA